MRSEIQREFTREYCNIDSCTKEHHLSLSFSPPAIWRSPSVDFERPFNDNCIAILRNESRKIVRSFISCGRDVTERAACERQRGAPCAFSLPLDKNARHACQSDAGDKVILQEATYLAVKPLSFYHGCLRLGRRASENHGDTTLGKAGRVGGSIGVPANESFCNYKRDRDTEETGR